MRTVTCVDGHGNQAPVELCRQELKEETSRLCNMELCPKWQTAEWSQVVVVLLFIFFSFLLDFYLFFVFFT